MLNRRIFLAGSLSSALIGCRQKPAVIRDAQREQHLGMLERYRVDPGAIRTNPPRLVKKVLGVIPLSVVNEFPQLQTRVKVTIRLHPRFSTEPKPLESKLGGQFAWPVDEPWPVDGSTSMLPILQIRKEDAPPTVKFQPGSDLFQILLHPSDEQRVMVTWRNSRKLQEPFAQLPKVSNPADLPVPCRLFPERVLDLPDAETMPEGEFKRSVLAFQPPPESTISGKEYYRRYLAAIPGTKVGGYMRYALGVPDTSCSKCRFPMDFLATLATDDWDNDSHWAPMEEQSEAQSGPCHGWSRAADYPRKSNRHVFVCTRCVDWPAKVIVE